MFKRVFLTLLLSGLLLSACGDRPASPANPGATSTPPSATPAINTASPEVASGGAGVSAPLKPGRYEQTMEFEGRKRSYILYLPAAITNQKPLPLLLVLHGGGGEGKGMEGLTGFSRMADQKGFIVVYPDAVDKNWNDGRESPFLASQRDGVNDVGFISALLDKLVKTLKIDQKQIYATGMSNGGIMSQRLGCELSGKIAAIAPVAGSMAEKLEPDCKPSRPVPVLLIHGTDDPLVRWQGGAVIRDNRGTVLPVPDTVKKWVRLDGCNATPEVSREPDKDSQDGTQVRREVYAGCKAGSEVVLYAVEGGGHTWPGGSQYLPEAIIGKTNRDINASEIIWDFFNKHPEN